jgi:hypothetical protein
VVSAVPLIRMGFRKPDREEDAPLVVNHNARRHAATPWYRTAETFFDVTSSAPRRVKVILQRQPVLAVALKLMREVPETATEFWEGLAKDDGLARADPRKALLYALNERYNDKAITPQLFLVAGAWNAFCAGKKVKRLQAPSDRRFWLAGTTTNTELCDANAGNDCH